MVDTDIDIDKRRFSIGIGAHNYRDQKAYNLTSAMWTIRKASGGIQSKSEALRIMRANSVNPTPSLKAQESKNLKTRSINITRVVSHTTM